MVAEKCRFPYGIFEKIDRRPFASVTHKSFASGAEYDACAEAQLVLVALQILFWSGIMDSVGRPSLMDHLHARLVLLQGTDAAIVLCCSARFNVS
jgi:hypothetical protein